MLLTVLSGAQFKALVEYAPSQQVPKSNIKKDGREGTITKGNRRQSLLPNSLYDSINLPYYHSSKLVFLGITRSGILGVS